MQAMVFTEPQQGASYDTQLAVARAAERLGFAGYFRSDHFLAMGTDGLPGPTDAWVTLAGLARETQRLRLGTLVSSATFRWPGLLAVSVAQVDAMSGGRVELGLGTGWFEEEHRAYGVPFPGLAERFAALEEQLEVVTGMWATPAGQRYSFTGRRYRLIDSPALPKPAQRPRPPIVVGGSGRRRTPRLAATYADELNVPFASLADTQAVWTAGRAACETVGRQPGSLRLSAALVLCCGRDEAEVARRAAAIGREPAELRENGAAGTPAEVSEKLAAYVAAGAERVYLQTLDLHDLDHLALVAEEVLPGLG